MKPAIIELPDLYRGCVYPAIIFHWKDLNGEPFSLFGWVPICFAREFSFNARVTDAQHGESRMVINKEATATIKLGRQAWDFIWVTGTNIWPPILSGVITVREPLSSTIPSNVEPMMPDDIEMEVVMA